MRHDSNLESLEALFRAKPDQWISCMELMQVAGYAGWRTRISECRTQLHMQIVNRTERQPDGRRRSWYRYVSQQTSITQAAQ